MKVLHLSYSDYDGGAAKAVLRLHLSLLRKGIDSHLLVSKKNTKNSNVDTPQFSFLQKIASRFQLELTRLPEKFFAKKKTQSLMSFNWFKFFDLERQPAFLDADIINLTWIGSGFMTPKQISKIKKPVTWRLSDMWPFTGGCHYSADCKKFREQCGTCPILGSENSSDLTRRFWKQKRKAFELLDLTVIAPSQWIADRARESSIFSNKRIKVIYTGVDTVTFKPQDKIICRSMLNLPREAFIILFGATRLDDERKGLHLLTRALDTMGKKGQEAVIALFGDNEEMTSLNLPLKTYSFGRLEDALSLSLVYSAADLFILPTLEDNLPNTLLEAMACGTPVLAFKTGGIPEVIEQARNGFLAENASAVELAKGIDFFTANPEKARLISQEARQTIVKGFTLERQAEAYISLFQEMALHRSAA